MQFSRILTAVYKENSNVFLDPFSCPFALFNDHLLTGMEVGAWVAFGYFTQAIGLQTSDASVCAFLCSLTVVSGRQIAPVKVNDVCFCWSGCSG